MVVVAHPDDESLGAGISLAQARRITFVHVTDGARSFINALSKGFLTRAHYAQARQKELRHALFTISAEKEFVSLGLRDQRAAYHIAETAKSLRQYCNQYMPDLILTHAFEGGHPDHDATAMAVHLATSGSRTPLYEMSGYNRFGGQDQYGAFVPRPGTETIIVPLTPEEQSQKKAMLAAFSSQKKIVEKFPVAVESFRLAPQYDFRVAPHEGPLYYEAHKLGTTWPVWNELARAALGELKL